MDLGGIKWDWMGFGGVRWGWVRLCASMYMLPLFLQPTMNELKGTIARIKLELKSLSEETPQERRLVLQDKLVKYQVALHWMAEVDTS